MNGCMNAILANDPDLTQTILIVGLILIIGSLFLRRAWKVSQRGGPANRMRGPATSSSARLQQQSRQDIDEMMLRLEELSREICGQIDVRFAKLEHAVREADERLTALRTAIQKARAAGAGAELQAPLDPRHERILRLHCEGKPAAQIARELDMPAGEVELVLALDRTRKGQGNGANSRTQPSPTEESPRQQGDSTNSSGIDHRA